MKGEGPTGNASARAVRVRSWEDTDHGDLPMMLVDSVEDPVCSSAGAVAVVQRRPKSFSHAVGVVEQHSDDELERGKRDEGRGAPESRRHLTRAPRSIRYRMALCDNRPEHHGRRGQSPWEAHSGGSFTRSRGATRDTALSEAITERLEQTRCFNGKFSG